MACSRLPKTAKKCYGGAPATETPMRFFFLGPRLFGVRAGLSFGLNELLRATSKPVSTSQMTGSFVYVIEGENGRHKIGSSRDPIQRISELQTGSPVPLKFAYIGVTPGTGFDIEHAAHALLDAQRTHREWFAVPASIAIGAVMESASRIGQPIQQVPPEIVPQIIYQASTGSAPPKQRLQDNGLFILACALIGGSLSAYYVWSVLNP
jgi:hypothetical protein